MKINEFIDTINSIREILDNDDVDVVVVGKENSGAIIPGSDLQFNYVNEIHFDRENKKIQIFYHEFNTTN